MKGLLRQPFAILAALGMLNLARDAIQWNDSVLAWIDAWRALTRPTEEFLFGWFPAWLHLRFPNSAKDYISMSAITSTCLFRSFAVRLSPNPQTGARIVRMYGIEAELSIFDFETIQEIFQGALVWPMTIMYVTAVAIWNFAHKEDKGDGIDPRIFFESFVWVAIILAINFALLRAP